MFIFLIVTLITAYILSTCVDFLKEFGISKKLKYRYGMYAMIFFTLLYYIFSLNILRNIIIVSVSSAICVFLLFLVTFLSQTMFSYMPKKSREIYDYVFAHRGFHLNVPENSLPAYKPMIGKYGIELDVRYLKKDGTIICFHDRYTSRLLGIPGKTNSFTYKQLQQYKYVGSDYKVVKFSKVLKVVDGKSPLLIETKGLISKDFIMALEKLIKDYDGVLYFHSRNLITYFKLNRLHKGKVFWVFNIFRKRFNFLKGKHYKNQIDRLASVFENGSIEIASIEDISQMLVDAFEGSNSVKAICASIAGVINNYQTRVVDNHWLLKSLILHRGIISDKYKEHSKEAFEACVKYAEKTNTKVAIELDLLYRNNQVVCYHSDKVSDKLGQEKSCAGKLNFAEALTLEQIIDIVKGHEDLVSVVFDFKDFKSRNRILEKEFIRIIEAKEYTGNFSVQAWNPFVLMYFEKIRPEYIRGQVGHSLCGLVKYVPLTGVPWIVNVLLFNHTHADYCVYDASDFIYVLIKYNKDIKGRPVFIYAPKTERQMQSFIGKEQISGFIVENVLDQKSWSKSYVKKFKKK